MKQINDPSPPVDAGQHCGCKTACASKATSEIASATSRESVADTNWGIFRIPAMDCPNEENDIRKALTGIEGIRSLRFELASRTLTIDGEQSAQESALQAIRHLGFEVLPIEHEQMAESPSGLGEISKALIALALAIGAEALDFFAPDTLLLKGLGMALAAAAIAFSGFSTYRKGLSALRRGQLNMNALMGVAVTGAFLIGQWPEAAMVMALYAIAELIEARSVDRARNAIKGLLALAPETAEIGVCSRNGKNRTLRPIELLAPAFQQLPTVFPQGAVRPDMPIEGLAGDVQFLA